MRERIDSQKALTGEMNNRFELILRKLQECARVLASLS